VVGQCRATQQYVPIHADDEESSVLLFDVVLGIMTIRRSFVGTHHDLAEALAFAVDGKVRTYYGVKAIENSNSISDCMRRGPIKIRIVMSIN
jgi:propanol-preferring alcohol dehydrogenase